MTAPPSTGVAIDEATREALAELLLVLADDEFVIGFWDSEWTGIAPVLEEDVAFSSLAQDEIGHARAYHELRSAVTGEDGDSVAFGRDADSFRHARLLDHPRTDWAFSVCRRWLYDTADSVRVEALTRSAYQPLAQLAVKIRREERYHLAHVDDWLGRLAGAAGEPRERLAKSLSILWPDALSVLSDLQTEPTLLAAGILPEPMAALRDRWVRLATTRLGELGLEVPAAAPPSQPRSGPRPESFRWLWGEFTSVARLEPGATW
jgi:ring-1,2-phenylacetyl-CoA epoxidase subunit PaaC